MEELVINYMDKDELYYVLSDMTEHDFNMLPYIVKKIYGKASEQKIQEPQSND